MKKLCTPLEEAEVRELKLGDIVYLDGKIYTARDKAHRKIIEYIDGGKGKEIPIKKGAVIYHSGPLMHRGEEKWEVIAAGPTTSSRMEDVSAKVIKRLDIRAIIGKGGVGTSIKEMMGKEGCVFLSFTGGAAVLAAKSVKDVINVYWSDLGMIEAVWLFKIENFGPLVVSIDACGNSLYERVIEGARRKLVANGYF